MSDEFPKRMTFHWSALAAIVVGTVSIVAGSCGREHDKDRGPELVARAGGPAHVLEAARTLRSYAKGSDEVLIPPNAWPEAFRRLAPEAISADAGGVYISTRIDTFKASGLYVVFDTATIPKGLGEDLVFHQLSPGIYWYVLIMGG